MQGTASGPVWSGCGPGGGGPKLGGFGGMGIDMATSEFSLDVYPVEGWTSSECVKCVRAE